MDSAMPESAMVCKKISSFPIAMILLDIRMKGFLHYVAPIWFKPWVPSYLSIEWRSWEIQAIQLLLSLLLPHCGAGLVAVLRLLPGGGLLISNPF